MQGYKGVLFYFIFRWRKTGDFFFQIKLQTCNDSCSVRLWPVNMAIRKTVFLCAVVGVVMVLHGAKGLHLKVNGIKKKVSQSLYYFDYFKRFLQSIYFVKFNLLPSIMLYNNFVTILGLWFIVCTKLSLPSLFHDF